MVKCNLSSLNSSENSTVACSPLQDRHVLSTHPALNGIQFALGVLVLVVNLAFLWLLYQRRKRLQWKRYAFVANTAVADAFGGVALIVIAAFAFFEIEQSGQTVFQLLALYTVLAASLSVTVESYDMLILVQYLAIRHPLWYKTLVTRRKIGVMLAWIWTVNPGYATFKVCLLMQDQDSHYRSLMIYELCFLCITCFWNTSTYFYVLSVAAKKKSQLHSVRMGAGTSRSSYSVDVSGTGTGSADDVNCSAPSVISITVASSSSGQNSVCSSSRHSSAYNLPNGSRLSICQEFLRQYRFLATAGLNLMAYWVSLVPLIVVYCYMLYHGQRMYFNETMLKHVAILLWFVRSLCDPMIYMVREKKLRRNGVSGRSKEMMQAGLTNHQHSQHSFRGNTPQNTAPVSCLNPSVLIQQ